MMHWQILKTPKEAEGLHFDGWEWWSGSEKLTEMPKSMPAADVTAYGTTTKRYVSYELDGSVYKTKEFAAIGSTVAVADTPVLTGYDVSDWTAEMADTAESVTITDGSFVMPDGDVVLKATTTPKKYQVTVNVDGQPVTGSPFTAEYLSRFVLPKLPAKEGLTFYWDNNTTDFSIMQENGTYYVDSMPAQDITINGYYTQSVHDIYFIVEGEAVGEWVPYKIIKDQVVGTTIWSGDIIPELKEEDAAAGKKFWDGYVLKLKEVEKVPSKCRIMTYITSHAGHRKKLQILLLVSSFGSESRTNKVLRGWAAGMRST